MCLIWYSRPPPIGSFNLQCGVLRKEVENITTGFVMLGAVQQSGCWHLTPRSKTPDGDRALKAGLAIATNVLHLQRVACIRACRVISTMPAIGQYASCECLVWLRGGSPDTCWYYTPEAGDLGRNFPARALAQEVVEVDKGLVP